MKNLLILGAGQYGMVAREIAESMQYFNNISFLDDNNTDAVGTLNDYKNLLDKYEFAVVALGNVQLRLNFIQNLLRIGYAVPVLVHKQAYVSKSAKIGAGTFIEPMAVIHTDVVVGNGCIISAGAIVNHNACVQDGCHLDCGTIVKARATTEKYTKYESGQIVGLP